MNTTYSRLEWAWRLQQPQRRAVYAIAVPALWLLCIAAICANSVVLASVAFLRVRTGRHPSSSEAPIVLRLTYSLSACDLWLSALLTIGLYVFTYAPTVLGSTLLSAECDLFCCSLRHLFEAVRLGAALSAVGHLVVMAVIHYRMVASPMKIRFLSKRRSNLILAALWLTPPLVFMGIFAAVSRSTPITSGCSSVWMNAVGFRAPLCGAVVCALVVCAVLYIRMLWSLNRSHAIKHSRQEPNRLNVSEALVDAIELSEATGTVGHVRQWGNRLRQGQTVDFLRTRLRTVTTALVILATSLIGWLPMVLWFLFTCDSCAFPVGQLILENPEVLLINGIVSQFLNIVKLLVNPIVYAYRVPEIRSAIGRLTHCGERSHITEEETIA